MTPATLGLTLIALAVVIVAAAAVLQPLLSVAGVL